MEAMDGSTLQSVWPLALLPVAARVGGLLLVAPVYGHPAVPVRLRLLAAVVVGLAVLGRSAPVFVPASLGELVLVCGLELALGAAIGWAAGLIFAGVELAAAHVGAQMGVSLGQAMGGEGEGEGGPVASLYRVAALAVFLLIGGHRQLLGGLLDSIQLLPVGGMGLPLAAGGPLGPAGVLGTAAVLLQASFILALKVAAPVLIAILLATVAMGLLHRALPPCHILSTDLPIRAMLGMLVMALGLAGLAWAVEAAWARTGQTLTDFLGGIR
jgi:flagellar biosynthetic protein FliR